MEEKNFVAFSEKDTSRPEERHKLPLVDNEQQAETTENEKLSAFSNKTWTTILVSCIPIASICLLVWLDEAILATAIPRFRKNLNHSIRSAGVGLHIYLGSVQVSCCLGESIKTFPQNHLLDQPRHLRSSFYHPSCSPIFCCLHCGTSSCGNCWI